MDGRKHDWKTSKKNENKSAVDILFVCWQTGNR